VHRVLDPSRFAVALEPAEALPRAVVDSMPGALLVVDSAHAITLANQQLESLFGYRSDELIGQSLELVIAWFRECVLGRVLFWVVGV
jgi:PAS domain-containing protein